MAHPLADLLMNKGYRVTAINKDYENCLILAENDSLAVINGDGTKPSILEDANAQDADIAIALTQRDADNLIICELCKRKFHVKKTVALINDPPKAEVFYQMGIDSAVCVMDAIMCSIE